MIDFLKYLFNPTSIALVLGGVLTSFFGFLAGISKSEKTPKWIVRGSFIAGLIVLVGGIYSGFEGQQLANRLQEKSEKIAALSHDIVELEKDNAKLTKRIADSVTGGDSYLEITPFIPVKSNMIKFMLLNRGQYPLYDVYIRILDLTMLKMLDYESVYKDQSLDPLKKIHNYETLVSKAAISLNLGNISANNVRWLGPFNITGADLDKKEQVYLITITARNGSTSVDIKAIKKDKNWEYSWRGIDTTNGHNKKVLYKVIRDEVPLD